MCVINFGYSIVNYSKAIFENWAYNEYDVFIIVLQWSKF